MDRQVKIRKEFCEYISHALIDRLTGESEEYCKFNKPSNEYPVGNIGVYTASENEDEEDETDDFIAKYAPFSFGMGFLVSPEDCCRLSINISFNVYYRVLPSFSVQKELPEMRNKLVKLYKKIKVNTATDFIVKFSDLAGKVMSKYKTNEISELYDAINSVRNVIASDENTFPSNEEGMLKVTTDLQNKTTFDAFISDMKTRPKMLPEWTPELCIEVKEDSSGYKFVTVTLQNPKCNNNVETISDNFLFNAELTVEAINGKIEPFAFNMLEDSYKYNRDMWGIGFNCAVDINNEQTAVRTVHAPVYRQLRSGDRQMLQDGEKIANPKFSILSEEPIPLLKDIENQMIKYLAWCRNNPDKMIDKYTTNRDKDIRNYNITLDSFESEIKRYGRGIKLLEKAKEPTSEYFAVYTSFLLMNRVFMLSAGDKYNSWRLFQIVFIVSELVGVAAQHWQNDDMFTSRDVEQVTVLWFPTGGGKTEAYLGLTVFNLFFDRLRGKDAGMTALLRFPLRILTLQQFQRIFNVIMFANKVKEENRILGTVFSLGYWAGSDQTPNSISKALKPSSEEDRKWHEEIEKLKKGDPKAQDSFRRVFKCPFCASSIATKFYNEINTVAHYCTNSECQWTKKHDIMPVFIADDDLYKHLPSLVVSTVDKVAVFGMQKNFLNLFGFVSFKNQYTGTFSWYKENDEFIEISETKSRLYKPTLQIQDELHLLKEDLGAYDSHYESTMQALLRERSGKYSWKIIASTATIRDYDRHIAHLYGKNESENPAIRFPSEGPRCDESFYSIAESKESIGRYYIGITGHNKTHINTIVDVIYNYHKIIKSLKEQNVLEFTTNTGIVGITQAEQKQILEDYEISLNYVLTKRNADQIAESINSQIQEYLVHDGYIGIKNEMLTGGTTGERLTTILNAIEHPPVNPEDRITSVTATSMISHGVDIERFNFMTFFGLPRQTAEYIQASSRVGRKWPGITVDVFAPQKERDKSYYQFFYKYHEYLDRLVEAPAINRWAKYSINKTIPGIMSGFIVNLEARRLGKGMWFMNNINSTLMQMTHDKRSDYKVMLREKFKEYYAVKNAAGETFEHRITYYADQFSNELLKISKQKSITDAVTNITGYSPMRSLRDTEEEAKFYPSDDLMKHLDSADYFGGK